MSPADIRHAVAELSENERGNLAAWILDSLPPHDGDDATAASIEEATRRRSDLDAGRAQSIAPSELWSLIDRERSQWK